MTSIPLLLLPFHIPSVFLFSYMAAFAARDQRASITHQLVLSNRPANTYPPPPLKPEAPLVSHMSNAMHTPQSS